jgi:hypothetical protein
MRNKFIWVILGASIILNITFFAIDIFPVLQESLSRKMANRHTPIENYEAFEKIILSEALNMAASKDHIMPFDEQTHFIGEIKKKLKSGNPSENDRFDYPKALLFSGLTEYALAKKDTALMEEIASLFNGKIPYEPTEICLNQNTLAYVTTLLILTWVDIILNFQNF